MKKFLKKTNRGVVLGAAIIFFLVIYIIIDNISFQNNKNDISTLICDYTNDYFKAYEAKDLDKLQSIISEYWTYNSVKNDDGWYTTKNTMLYELKENSPKTVDTDFSFTRDNAPEISISKVGPGIAKADIYYTYKADYKNLTFDEYLMPFGLEYPLNFDGSNPITEGSMVFGCEYSIYLRFEDDKWYISDIDGYSYVESVDTIIEEVE